MASQQDPADTVGLPGASSESNHDVQEVQQILDKFREFTSKTAQALHYHGRLGYKQQHELLDATVQLALRETLTDGAVDENGACRDSIIASLIAGQGVVPLNSDNTASARKTNSVLEIQTACLPLGTAALEPCQFRDFAPSSRDIETSPYRICPVLEPSQEQWKSLDKLLQCDGAEEARCGFSIIAYPKVEGQCLELQEPQAIKYTRHKFPGSERSDGIVALTHVHESHTRPAQNVGIKTMQDIKGLVAQFETLITQTSENGADSLDVLYASSIPACTKNERIKVGLPLQGPLSGLKNNKLARTRELIPGLHTPYAYRALSKWAPFYMHREDFDLISLNYLYAGQKVWIVISPNSINRLEKRLQPDGRRCAQFLRHGSTWVLTRKLDEWDIQYRVICQQPGEIVIIHPKAYHQGFSTTATVAEAVNYAPPSWTIDGYTACTPGKCPRGPLIERTAMELRSHEEESLALEPLNNNSGYDTTFKDQEIASPASKQPRAKHSAVPKRTLATSVVVNRAYSPLIVSVTRPHASEYSQCKSSKKRKQPSAQVSICKKLKPTVNPERWEVHFRPKSKVETALAQLNGMMPPEHADIFHRLFFAIGSGTALRQLKVACRATETVPTALVDENVGNLLDCLLQIDYTSARNHILQRYLMVRLIELRQLAAREQKCLCCPTCRAAQSDGKPWDEISQSLSSNSVQSIPRKGRPRCRALGQLVGRLEGGRNLEARTKILSDVLYRGKVWYSLKLRFSFGLLALIPTQEIFGVTSTKIQRAFEATTFSCFVEMLHRQRGDVLREASGYLEGIFDRLLRRGSQKTWMFEDPRHDRILETEDLGCRLTELCKHSVYVDARSTEQYAI